MCGSDCETSVASAEEATFFSEKTTAAVEEAAEKDRSFRETLATTANEAMYICVREAAPAED